MNMIEMVLAMLAVVFFSTVALMYNRAVWDQSELLIHANKYIQASHLSHSVLDEVDARLFSKQLAFASIKTAYNTTRSVNMAHSGGIYKMIVTAVDCDSLGVPLASWVSNNIYTRVSVSTTTPGLKRPVVMRRVYTKTHLNL
jgi:hypothetical protein